MATGDFPFRVTPTGYERVTSPSEDLQQSWMEGNDMHMIMQDGRHFVYSNVSFTSGGGATVADGTITIPVELTYSAEEVQKKKVSRYDLALKKKPAVKPTFELCKVCGDAIYDPKNPDGVLNCGYPLCECGHG